MVSRDRRSSTYMSHGPSPRVVFIQETLSTTRRSPKIGWGARSGDIGLPSLGTVTFIAASIGVVSLPVMIWAFGFWARIVSTWSGENEAMKSISPALNAAISVTGSLITRMITLSR